ncbi:hypothetical protein ACI784_14355 [Geodermatophilus sp. SYSU D01186]
MSALTPDCDPDLSNCGSPVGNGPGIGSTLVLLAVLAVSVPVATGTAAPGVVAFLAGGAGVVSALVLVRRTVRLVRRVAPQNWAPAARRSRPVG